MDKSLNINTGNAYMLNERSEIFSGYDSVNLNAGDVLISRKVYDKLTGMGVSINCGKMNIIDIVGDVTELADNAVITSSALYSGCYLACFGNLIIEDAAGLEGITGLYAKSIFHAESVDISHVRGITASERIVYPDGAKLQIGDMTLGGDSHSLPEGGALNWVHGTISALDEGALEKLRLNKNTFHCKRLIIYTGLYEKYRDMIQADSFLFIPDGYAVAGDVTLDAATSLKYGDKLFVLGDFLAPIDQTRYLKDFTSIIIHGTATLPVSAISDFRALGKAENYDVYEGVLLTLNGFQTIGHEQLQSAIERGISYTIHVNGALYFFDDVTAQDMDAVAAVYCNGMISAPDRARAGLDVKVRSLNGTILDIDAMIKKLYGEDFSFGNDPISFIKGVAAQIQGGSAGSGFNTGMFKM